MVEMIKVPVSGFPFFFFFFWLWFGLGPSAREILLSSCFFLGGRGGNGALTLHHSLFHFWTDGRPR